MNKKKFRKILIWTLAVTLLAGLVWAVNDQLGQSNKIAADCGSNAAKTDMASLSSIKPTKAKSKIDWKQEKALKDNTFQVDAEYMKILDTANKELATASKVSDATRSSGIAAANSFKEACEQYALFWDKNKGQTRAKLSREVGASRVKSAEMAFNSIDKDKIEAFNKQQDSMRKAQSEYMSEAKTDLSPADKAALKADLTPRVQNIANNLTALVQSLTGLLNQVKDQMGSGGISAAVGGCATTGGSGGSPASNVAALLTPLNSLMTLLKGMITNAQGLMADLNGL